MARKLTAEELRAKARSQLKKELLKAKKLEEKENQELGKKLRECAKKANLTAKELLEYIECNLSKEDTAYKTGKQEI